MNGNGETGGDVLKCLKFKASDADALEIEGDGQPFSGGHP